MTSARSPTSQIRQDTPPSKQQDTPPSQRQHRRIVIMDLRPYRKPYLPGASLDRNELATGDASFGESWFGGRGVKPCVYLCHPGLVYDPYDDKGYYETNRSQSDIVRKPAPALTAWLREIKLIHNGERPQPFINIPNPKTGDERLRQLMTEVRLQLGVVSGCKVSNDWRIRILRRSANGAVPDTVLFPSRLKDVGVLEQLAQECDIHMEQYHGNSEALPSSIITLPEPFVALDNSFLTPVLMKNHQEGNGVAIRSGALLSRVDLWLKSRRLWLDNRQALGLSDSVSLWHWMIWNLPTETLPSSPTELGPAFEVPSVLSATLDSLMPKDQFETNSHADTYGPWLHSILDANTTGHSLATGTVLSGGVADVPYVASDGSGGIRGSLVQYLQLRAAEGQRVLGRTRPFVSWGVRSMPPAHHLAFFKFTSLRRAVAFWQKALTLRTSGTIFWGQSAVLINALLRDCCGESLGHWVRRAVSTVLGHLGNGKDASSRKFDGAVVTVLVEGEDRPEVGLRFSNVVERAQEFGGELVPDVYGFYRRTKNLMFKDIFWSQGWTIEDFEQPAMTVLEDAFPAIKTLLDPIVHVGEDASSSSELVGGPVRLPRCLIPRGTSSNVTVVQLDCLTLLSPNAQL